MSNLSYAQLEGLWLVTAKGTTYGTQAWAALMAAIAEAESGGNPDETNPNDNNGKQTSWGLWQISLGNHNAPSPNWADPATNAQLALAKLQSQGLDAWGTYTSGAYKAYVSSSTTPDTSIPANAAALTAETAAASSSDCLYGLGGIPGTSWITDLTGSGGNIGNVCIITRSEARGWIGAGLMALGSFWMLEGVGFALLAVGLQTPVGGSLAGAGVGLATRGLVRGAGPAGADPGAVQPIEPGPAGGGGPGPSFG
jgi:Lysozyme like domain